MENRSSGRNRIVTHLKSREQQMRLPYLSIEFLAVYLTEWRND